METPSKAADHFVNLRYDDNKKKFTMQCKHCLKVLIDGKNTTCRVSHLRSCRPNLPLINNVANVRIRKFHLDIASSTSSSSSDSLTSSQSPLSTPTKNTPLKSMLLSQTPYHNNSVERNKLLNLVLELIVDMNLPISIVDHPSFVKLTNGLNNRFKLPCRQTMRKTVIPQKVLFLFIIFCRFILGKN